MKIFYKNNFWGKGFTLPEIMVSIAILSIIFGTTAFTLSDKRDDSLFKESQANVLLAIERAQNRAATGVGMTNHGIHIEENKIVIFKGDVYLPGQGEETLLPPSISIDQTNLDIVFQRLNTMTNLAADKIIQISQGSLNQAITITKDGFILCQ